MKNIITLITLAFLSINATFSQEKPTINLEKSVVNWEGETLYYINKHTGTVKFKKGNLILKDKKIIKGFFTIDMNTIINTDGKYNKGLVSHLKNSDFFDVDKYPLATLKIKKVTYELKTILKIKADLTIKGITKSINYRALLTDNVMISKFSIDRTRWKINYESKGILGKLKDSAISDTIDFEVKIIL